jgi:hypothetical protein
LSVIFNFLRVLAGYTISNFGLVTSFITNLALVTKMDHWNADQLEGQMAQYVGQDSRMLIPILSATVRTYGMNTAQKLLDGVEPPEGASKEYKELLSFAKDIFEEADEIIDEHTGDGDPDEVHGLDEDDYSKNALAEDVAFDMIAELDGRLGRGTLDLLRSSVIIEQAHIERYRKLFPRGRHNY